MRTVAYKISNNIKSIVTDSLPSNWITEYTFVDLHQEGILNSEDGWLFISEDEFNNLLDKTNNDNRMNEFIELQNKIRNDNFELMKIKLAEMQAKKAEEDAEFEAFKAWKASQNQ